MRLLIAGMAALVAVAFAMPSYANDENTPAPAPAPIAKPKAKPGTAAYCQKLKTSSARTSCLKKISAKSHHKAKPTTTAKKSKKAAPPPAAPKQPDLGQLTPPAAPAAPVPASNGTVAVPPLPQKTI